MKKFYLIAFSCAAVALAAVGCKGKSQPVPSKQAAPAPTQGFTYDTSKSSWDQNKDPIELNWFVAYDWENMHFDPQHNEFDKYVYDSTGVKIKFSIGNQEKLNMLIATNSLPDIVTYDAASTERLAMENGGKLYPLDDLMKKYAPDMHVPKAMMDWYRNDKDGHWYAYVGYFADLKEAYAEGSYVEVHNMNFARKDIMEKLGIDPASLQTKEGFLAALRKVKASGIEYDGQKVIPYIGTNVDNLAEQMGVDREDKQGNLINIKRQPEYLEALLFLNQIYTEGLTTDEIFTMDSTTQKQLVASGQVFAGTNQVYLKGKEDLFHKDPNALMEGVGFIKGSEGKTAYVSPSPTGGWAATMITKHCKNPQRATALLSFLTQPEISLSYYYGGINGYDLVNNEAIVKPERLKEQQADPSAFDAKYKNPLQDLVCDYTWVIKYEPKTHADAYVADKLHYQKTWADGHLYDDKLFVDVNPDSGTDLAGVKAQLDNYWNQQFPKIVMAKSPQEATKIYDDTIAQMDTMGMKDLDQFQNEKFQKNKKKMGIKFAWPRNQENGGNQ